MADERALRRPDARAVTLEPHDPRWMEVAAAEARSIQAAIPSIIDVAHIGSTAIPGIAAKPIIDLMPVVRDAGDLDGCRVPMEARGYLWRGEYGIPGRRYCVLERDGRRIFHVHMFAAGSAEIANHLVFRDFLRAHRQEALAYEAAKTAAAAACPDDSLAYSKHKSAWVRACLTRAQAWRSKD